MEIIKEIKAANIDVENNVATINGFTGLFENVVSVVLAITGIVLFIMLLIGGIQYIRSGQDAAKAEASRKTITTAIKWAILIILASLVLIFIKEFTGVDVTEFNIVQP